jgi:signal transduction protein with GAF and PtsI domain
MRTQPTVEEAVRPDADGAPAVMPVIRNGRTIGVVLADGAGYRWQPTRDVDHLVTVATVTAGAVAAAGLVAAAFRRPRVQRITMGPGGWVSFKGTAAAPRIRGPRRPWWAVLLRARPLDQTR